MLPVMLILSAYLIGSFPFIYLVVRVFAGDGILKLCCTSHKRRILRSFAVYAAQDDGQRMTRSNRGRLFAMAAPRS
jgi:hypothetical protein